MKQIDTIILVDDIKKSNTFYKDILGLEILHDWGSMIIYKNRLAIHQVDLLQPQEFVEKLLNNGKQGSNNLIIYLELDNDESLEEYFNNIKKEDIEIIHGIYALPWQRIFRIYDPDKHIIEIGEPEKE